MAFPLRRAGGRSAECQGQRRRQTTARPAPNSDADGPCLDRPAEKAQPPFRPSASHSEKRPTRVVKKTAAESSPSETETTFHSVRFRSSRGLAASSFVCLLLFFCAIANRRGISQRDALSCARPLATAKAKRSANSLAKANRQTLPTLFGEMRVNLWISSATQGHRSRFQFRPHHPPIQ